MKVGDLVRGNTKRKNPFLPQVESSAIITDIDPKGWITVFWISGPLKDNVKRAGFRPIELEVLSESR